MPLVAAGDVHQHVRARLALKDVLTATRLGRSVAEAGAALFPNAERHLKSLAALQTRFARVPAALARTLEIAERSTFSLDELRYEYPEELAPAGETPLEYLTRLAWSGAGKRYPGGVPDKVRRLVEHELQLIGQLHYEAYFLTVFDLVRFARRRSILCQGRGSAANSAVCYCLGVTSVDPSRLDVLFERFIERRAERAPDIDVDFEHERREEVLQYLYEKYGRERSGMTAEVITYRPRSAVRDVGKALGLSLDRVDLLAKSLEGHSLPEHFADRCRDAGIDPESFVGSRLVGLVGELIGFPRHLGQHVGGMVMTRGPLCELVPIENAAMADRTVIQWDKNDLDELGILKVDCLSLGMLTAIRKCFALVERHTGRPLTLATVPAEDPQVYDMICRADTMGVFQIESRAQMSMLPRLRPREYYDLVIEVAIVRPGPIQGNMVHPYLRRRAGEEPVSYPNDEIRAVLAKTLGVPLFQEQAMRLAVVAAGFTPGEADQLRRAMGAWRRTGVIEQFRQKLLAGMAAKGLPGEFAENVFRQIRGFGEYGFPESHAASFALLVYVSAWLKCHHPAAFTAALLNSQPMGFYAPAQLVGCAREHGVEVRPIDVNASDWDCTLEKAEGRRQKAENGEYGKPRAAGEAGDGKLALRLGLEDDFGIVGSAGAEDRGGAAGGSVWVARRFFPPHQADAGRDQAAGRGRRVRVAGGRPPGGALASVGPGGAGRAASAVGSTRRGARAGRGAAALVAAEASDRRLSHRGFVAASSSAAIRAGGTRAAAGRAGRGTAAGARRGRGPRGRPGADAAAAGHCQGHHVRHAGRRNRLDQPGDSPGCLAAVLSGCPDGHGACWPRAGWSARGRSSTCWWPGWKTCRSGWRSVASQSRDFH